jgi:hypothetical protein
MTNRLALCLLVPLMLLMACPDLHAGPDMGLRAEIESLIYKHSVDGIDYSRAKALGSEAIPFLVEKLNDPDKKEFWVNIIVSLGFIEDPEALPGLIEFLESAHGEVDIYTFRALLSVPFAIGCISSSGDRQAYTYLAEWIDLPQSQTVNWSFHNKNIHDLLSQQAIMGMAVSGLPEAKKKLADLRNQPATKSFSPAVLQARINTLNTASSIMSRMEQTGRAGIFNHQVNR